MIRDFRVRDFAIQRTELSRSLEQATEVPAGISIRILKNGKCAARRFPSPQSPLHRGDSQDHQIPKSQSRIT